MTNFWKRAFTGIGFVAILLASLCSEWSFFVVFLFITTGATKEFYNLAALDGNKNNNVAGGMILSATFFTEMFFGQRFVFFPYDFPYISALMFVGLLVCELFRDKGNSFKNWSQLIMSQMFIALPFVLTTKFIWIWEGESYCGEFNSAHIFLLLFLIWANDTFAYLCGVLFGKHKFFERISPKKTWEGFVGGLAFATLAAWLVSLCNIGYFEKTGSLLADGQWFWTAIVVVVAGTFGDLIESQLKRSVGTKDSGRLLPGHGGLLDRFDSFMLAVPAVLIYQNLCGLF